MHRPHPKGQHRPREAVSIHDPRREGGAGIGAVAGGLTAMALPGSQAYLVPMGAMLGGQLGGQF